MNDQPNLSPSGSVQNPNPHARKSHRWSADGETCLDCGDKDWRASSNCEPTPPQPAPDRHEASRAAFEKYFPHPSTYDSSKNVQEHLHRSRETQWEGWKAALRYTAQEQRRPCGECRVEAEPFGISEELPPGPPTQTAHEWLLSWYDDSRPQYQLYNFAVDLAARCDAAERRLASSERARVSLSDACDHLQAQVRAVQAEAERRLYEQRYVTDKLAEDFTNLHAQLTAAERRVERLRGALETEIAAVKKRRDGLEKFLRVNAQYRRDQQPTMDFCDEQIKRLEAALAETKEDASNE